MTSETILIKNAHIFDGHSPELSDRSSILLADGEIKEISTGATGSGSDHVVDAAGRTVMPGLIVITSMYISLPWIRRRFPGCRTPISPSMPMCFSMRPCNGALPRYAISAAATSASPELSTMDWCAARVSITPGK